jgi:hypothetical protein
MVGRGVCIAAVEAFSEGGCIAQDGRIERERLGAY